MISPATLAPGDWLRKNLFSSPLNTVLTLLSLLLLYLIIPPLLSWALFDADWSGDSREACSREGACWVFIKVWIKQLMYGRYPDHELWRIHLAYAVLALSMAPLFVPRFRYKQWLGLWLLVGYPLLAFQLFSGGAPGLAVVETRLWGGLFLTLVIAAVGTVASLPLGILLALGRRSSMPVVRAASIGFIELWRGVPLITVLFMASVMFPLFMPENLNFDKLLRALIGVTIFAAAYIAEVVRGGLQAIPRGQYEGAFALGLSYWKSMIFIILPQALKIVIPGLVNSFISLLKDTTLVLVIGLFDFLGMIRFAGTNPEWLAFAVEGYVFGAALYWVLCFGMSRYSRHLEKKLATGHAA